MTAENANTDLPLLGKAIFLKCGAKMAIQIPNVASPFV
jgi:hypothetical protein